MQHPMQHLCLCNTWMPKQQLPHHQRLLGLQNRIGGHGPIRQVMMVLSHDIARCMDSMVHRILNHLSDALASVTCLLCHACLPIPCSQSALGLSTEILEEAARKLEELTAQPSTADHPDQPWNRRPTNYTLFKIDQHVRHNPSYRRASSCKCWRSVYAFIAQQKLQLGMAWANGLVV